MPPILAGLPFQFQEAASRNTGWIVDPPTHGPTGGVADSLDEAKATFWTTWDVHGVSAFSGNCGRKMLSPSPSVDDPYRPFAALDFCSAH
jgi:hypothetical protein